MLPSRGRVPGAVGPTKLPHDLVPGCEVREAVQGSFIMLVDSELM